MLFHKDIKRTNNPIPMQAK